ncbi:MAG: cytochrome c1 [Pseudomonadota bacterium]
MKATRMMKYLLATVLLLPGALWAAASEYPMEPMEPNLRDKPSLQNGLRLYANYCLGCHSLEYQRYQRTANDLGIPEAIMEDEIIFTDQKIGEQMTNAMDEEAAKSWFGAPPPDLTMVARVRSPEWIYNYLKTFYVDENRPLGVNNKVFPNVGMPHVLMDLQGVQRLGCVQVPKIADNGGEMRDPLEPGKTITEEQCGQLVLEEGTGEYTPEQYDQAAYDIANFLYYVGEPSRLERYRLGVYVLLFIAILYVFTWLLGREYHKAVR